MGNEEVQQASQTPWKKYLAIGCAVFFFCGLCFAGCIGMGFYGVVSAVKSSEPYQMAEKFAKIDPVIKGQIGEVTGFGFMPSGSVNTSGSSGDADLSVSVNGKNGSGTLLFRCTIRNGKWKVKSAIFVNEAGKRFHLQPGQLNSR